VEVDHSVAVKMDGTTAIPLGELKLCHEDRVQAMFLCTKAFLQQLPSGFGTSMLPRTDLVESAMRKEISIKAEMLRTSNASIVLVSSSVGLLLSAGVGVVTVPEIRPH